MRNQILRVESDAKSDAPSKRPIQTQESDFSRRLQEAIGEESVASFGRRCGTSESLLRGYLKNGNKPGLDHLVSIADAANVSIEWLATGRGPKQRGASVPSIPPAPPIPPSFINLQDIDRLTLAMEAVEEGLAPIYNDIPAPKRARLVAAAYDLLIDMDQRDNVVKFVKLAA